MSRLWLLGLLAFVGLVGANYYDTYTSDQTFLAKQKKILNLLYHIPQPDVVNPQLYSKGQEWSIEANIHSYNKTEVAEQFLRLYKNGVLGRGEVFSVYYPSQLREMVQLFKLFYYANSFDVFYNTALWARNHMNEGVFATALYTAVINRWDTEFIQLPPLYELYPYYFYNSEVLTKAQNVGTYSPIELKKTDGSDMYVIMANYSGWYINREYDLENKLNYFVEDIGLNAYYTLFRLQYPFWLSSEEFGFPKNRGEEFLYNHLQLLNRYYLERFSNDLPAVEDFDWSKPFVPGFYPTMTFHNGLPFAQRPSWSQFPVHKYGYIKKIRDIESRISTAIDSGYILNKDAKWMSINTPDGANILGNLIEGNADSMNSNIYDSLDRLSRKVLGFNPETSSRNQIWPSALEAFPTSLRDPAFWRLCKRINEYYYRFKLRQKPYSMDEVLFPNLKIQSVTVDKLTTYFDQFDATISNGLLMRTAAEAESTLVKVRQYRLNHKPFNFHITVNSDKATRAAIKIFLGPKYDAHRKLVELPEGFRYFYEVDNWVLNLDAGVNKITRSSNSSFFSSEDPEPTELFYKRVLKAIEESSTVTTQRRIAGFPERLLLPKGKKEGIPYQLFVCVSPVNEEFQYESRVFGSYTFDTRPFGYPLNKPVPGFNYDAPNMIFKDIMIYHKDDTDTMITY
ncbi:hexamerin 70a [Nomia melanderi]|uniref:hexamerin 70a n=1 Tax=Nomia melanderi TaxID=2448451 RepID=UPI00130419DB|nr:arylphorin subunit alpha-like [Nomia melanderi]